MKTQILNYLEQKPYIKRLELLFLLREHFPYLHERAMRKEIELMVDSGENIGSSAAGYFIIRTDEQVKEAVGWHKSRAIKSFQRAKHIHDNYYKDKTGEQLEIQEFFDTHENELP